MVFGARWMAETGLTKIPADLKCFYCHTSIEAMPYINWMGTTEIELHPACVVELCLRLLRDVHEVECTHSLTVQLETAPATFSGLTV